MNVIQDDIEAAIEKELCGAIERFPMFSSPHEAIAVIAEEFDEAADELIRVHKHWHAAWDCVKGNSPVALDYITKMKYAAEHLAIEACQVAAMCEKAVKSAANWKDFTED